MKKLMFTLISLFTLFFLTSRAQRNFEMSHDYQISIEDLSLKESDLLPLFASNAFQVMWCKIDTLNDSVFVKNFFIVFKNKSHFNGAFVSSDFFTSLSQIRFFYVELDHVSGATLSLECSLNLKSSFPKLVRRLDYLLKTMKIKKYDHKYYVEMD